MWTFLSSTPFPSPLRWHCSGPGSQSSGGRAGASPEPFASSTRTPPDGGVFVSGGDASVTGRLIESASRAATETRYGEQTPEQDKRLSPVHWHSPRAGTASRPHAACG